MLMYSSASFATAGGRIDLPPPECARAALDPALGRRFVLFADAEEEFDWGKPLRRDQVSTSAIAALPAANRRFVAAGVVPTYLVDYPVVATPASAAAIREMLEDGACGIGTQLHPWVNPPFHEAVVAENSFVGNLPRDLERAKLHALTDKIEESLGRRPTIYRAGRYGIGPNTAALLSEAGYRMDVSVRALFDYSGEQGPDFSQHPVWPYWIDRDLLELPLTAAFTGRWCRWTGLHRSPWARGPLARAGLLNRVALTPEGMPQAEALEAIRRLIDAGQELFSLSFHTPSVEPGHTPYVRDARDLDAFWRWWDAVFDLFAKEGISAARPEEIVAAADRGRAAVALTR